jgi:hypothetical protein
MFIRRIYYDKITGEILHSYMMQGDILHFSPEKDFETNAELIGRSFADVDCMEWATPNEEIEDSFARCSSFSIVGGQLMFNFDPILIPGESSTTDMANALEILGVDP